MAGLAGSSLGWGIALTGKPEDGAKLFQHNLDQQREDQKRQRAKLDQDENDLREQMMKIQVEGVDPAYNPIIKQKAYDLIQTMKEKRDANPYGPWTNDPDLQKQLADLRLTHADYKAASDRIKYDFGQYSQDPTKYDAPQSESYQRYKRDPVAWASWLKGNQGSNIYSGGLFNVAEKPFDPYLPIKGMEAPTASYGSKIETPEGSKYSEGTRVDKTKLEDQVNNILAVHGEKYIKQFGDETAAREFLRKELAARANVSAKSGSEVKQQKDWKYGAGFAENNNYRFAGTEYEGGKVNIPLLGEQSYQGKGSVGSANVKEIKIARTDASDNKPLYINTGGPTGEKKRITPVGFRRVGDGDWKLVGVEKVEVPLTESQQRMKSLGQEIKPEMRERTVEIPVNEIKDDISAEFGGFDLRKFEEAQKAGEEYAPGATTKTGTAQKKTLTKGALD